MSTLFLGEGSNRTKAAFSKYWFENVQLQQSNACDCWSSFTHTHTHNMHTHNTDVVRWKINLYFSHRVTAGRIRVVVVVVVVTAIGSGWRKRVSIHSICPWERYTHGGERIARVVCIHARVCVCRFPIIKWPPRGDAIKIKRKKRTHVILCVECTYPPLGGTVRRRCRRVGMI